MKKVYTTPIAEEEAFAANTYVAKCAIDISSTSTQNKMRCIIPWHDDYNEYFTSVWLDATASNCDIKVTKNTTKTATNGNNFQPTYGATVYGADGTAYTCTKQYDTYYLPWSKPRWGQTDQSQHVGSYVNEGSYEEIQSKVFS